MPGGTRNGSLIHYLNSQPQRNLTTTTTRQNSISIICSLHRCVLRLAFVWQASGPEAPRTVQEVQEPTTDKKAELGSEAGLYGDDATVPPSTTVSLFRGFAAVRTNLHSASLLRLAAGTRAVGVCLAGVRARGTRDSSRSSRADDGQESRAWRRGRFVWR